VTPLSASEIADLVARHPLPEGVPDAVLNRTELAEFFGVSAMTITAWQTAGMPVQNEGRQGQAYEFQASHCHAWRQAREADETMRSQEAQAAIVAMRLALTGGSSGDTIEALDPKQRREIMAAQIEEERYRAHRNQLMQRADVRELLEQLFKIIRDTVEVWPDVFDRRGTFDRTVIDALEAEGDNLVASLRHRIEEYWRLRPVKERERESLFDDA